MKTITLPSNHDLFKSAHNNQISLEIGSEIKIYSIYTKQKGYGRQGVYAEMYIENEISPIKTDRKYIKDVYIMDVFPNINEHFNALQKNDAFYNEENDKYTDHNGNELDYCYDDVSDLFKGREIEFWLEEEEVEEITE